METLLIPTVVSFSRAGQLFCYVLLVRHRVVDLFSEWLIVDDSFFCWLIGFTPTMDSSFYTGGYVCWMISHTPDTMINWLIEMTESDWLQALYTKIWPLCHICLRATRIYWNILHLSHKLTILMVRTQCQPIRIDMKTTIWHIELDTELV